MFTELLTRNIFEEAYDYDCGERPLAIIIYVRECASFQHKLLTNLISEIDPLIEFKMFNLFSSLSSDVSKMFTSSVDKTVAYKSIKIQMWERKKA
jgi:hypothetical protein